MNYTDDARLTQTIVKIEHVVVPVSRYQKFRKIIRKFSLGGLPGSDSFESRFQAILVLVKSFCAPFPQRVFRNILKIKIGIL